MTRRLTAEILGTAGLLIAIVGSGIRSDGAGSTQLFQHAVVVGMGLAVLIATFDSVSGAHFNPAVTIVDALLGGVRWRVALGYVSAQLVGASAGVMGVNVLFGLPAVTLATTARSGFRLAASEVVATLGLLLIIFGLKRSGKVPAIAPAVGAWIAAAIYFTPSTSFANPAVTIARVLTDTYTGIRGSSLGGFVLGQLLAIPLGVILVTWLFDTPVVTRSAVSTAQLEEMP